MTSVEKLVEFLARGLVTQPDEVRVNTVEGETVVIVELQVHDDDVSRVIGEDGCIVKAIRQVLSAASGRRKTMLELVNTQDEPTPEAGDEE
jgi:predicted RNA-binding protein YlqC (UPF0109 family)